MKWRMREKSKVFIVDNKSRPQDKCSVNSGGTFNFVFKFKRQFEAEIQQQVDCYKNRKNWVGRKITNKKLSSSLKILFLMIQEEEDSDYKVTEYAKNTLDSRPRRDSL